MTGKENISQKDFERIDAFICDGLSEEDRIAFLKELKTNDDLKREVEIQRKIILAVETGAMKNQLDVIHQQLTSKRKQNIWFATAASVAVLIAVSIWFINKPSKSDNLFAANVTVDPGLPVPMSATNNYIFYDAMVDYKSGKYKLAIDKWKPLLLQNPENDTINYYIGSAFFNEEKFEQSISYFEHVSKLNQSSFYGKSEWYMALSFLKMKEFDRLQELAQNSQSVFSERIKQLNQKLE